MGFLETLPPERFEKDMPITESENICPYCKKSLNKKPKRKTKCPFCGNFIYVRSKPRIFNTTLLTKDDSIAVDWYNKLEWQGITQKDFWQMRENEFKTNKEIKSSEVIFHLYKRELSNSKDLHQQKVNNFELALLIYEIGGEFFGYLSESIKCQLMKYKQQGVKKVRIISPGGCSACIGLMGKILTIDDALKEMPIPAKHCTFDLHDISQGWCRCMYLAFFDDPLMDEPDSTYEDRKRRAREDLNRKEIQVIE